MKSVNTTATFIEEDFFGYGEPTKGFYFELSVTQNVAELIHQNCALCYTRYGAGEYTYQRVIGVVWDKTTNMIHCLDGSMDLGIHTGHPPRLRLHCGSRWIVVVEEKNKKVVRKQRGVVPTTFVLPVEYRDRNPDQIPFGFMIDW
jgi:hypothetical protein